MDPRCPVQHCLEQQSCWQNEMLANGSVSFETSEQWSVMKPLKTEGRILMQKPGGIYSTMLNEEKPCRMDGTKQQQHKI